MASRAGPSAVCRAVVVRAAVVRSRVFTLAQAGSMGVKSGEYGGRWRQANPERLSGSRPAAALWAERLSITITASGLLRFSAGRSTCSRSAWNKHRPAGRRLDAHRAHDALRPERAEHGEP